MRLTGSGDGKRQKAKGQQEVPTLGIKRLNMDMDNKTVRKKAGQGGVRKNWYMPLIYIRCIER